MRFEEVPPNLLPPGMRTWGARVGKFQFVISYEDGTTLRPEDREEWTGYSVSYQDKTAPKPRTVRIEGARVRSFDEAESICRAMWRQLRNKQ